MEDTCPRCGAVQRSTGGTTMLRCKRCGQRYAGPATRTLELTLLTDPGREMVEAVLDLDPAFRDRFALDRVIGSGGMGMVLLAHEHAAGRAVALKFMRLFADEEVAERFQREARLLLAIKHPNVVELFAIDHLGDHPVLIMEYLAGGTLKDLLARRGGQLPPAEAVETMLPVLAGLAALHRGGVIHRDLKPENVLFTDAGLPKIADLGIAKDYGDTVLTATGQVLGTPIYMSPEQARGDRPTVAADIYAVGCILYELIAGRPPFDVQAPFELIRLHQSVEPPPLASRAPHVSPKLAGVIHRTLAKSIVERPASCEDLALLLERAIGRQIPRALEEVSGTRIAALKPSGPTARPAAGVARTEVRQVGPPPAPPIAYWSCSINGAPPMLLAQDPLFIGRSPGPSELTLDDPGVSYRHALLIPEHTELKLLDFKSTNGLKVNGRTVSEHQLSEGDELTIGAQRLRFRRTPAADEPAAAPPAFMLSPEELTGWLEEGDDARERFGGLLELLMQRWSLARALLLAEHAPSGTLQLLAARPSEATALPACLHELPAAAVLGSPDPVVLVAESGRPAALLPLRAGGGQLYLETSPSTPDGLTGAAGRMVLAGVAGVLTLALALATPRAPAAEVS